MSIQWKWNPCINHRDDEYGNHAKKFIKEYFSRSNCRILLFAGAGFDPRSATICELLCKSSKNKIKGFFIREERPNPNSKLLQCATKNIDTMKLLVENHNLISINIFSSDGAVIGGREIVKSLRQFSIDGFTDIVIDISAMSIGISYPMVRYLHSIATCKNKYNLHLMVSDNPTMDGNIAPIASDKVGPIFAFQGGLNLDSKAKSVKLWLPQLMAGKKAILEKIHISIGEPKDICPILPFSASNPRLADELIDYYRDELESIWGVDERNIIYTDQNNPLDLYRAILRIDDARRRVFANRGSIVVLSPVGSKASAIGGLLAAIERDFPVVYVESSGYTFDFEKSGPQMSNHNKIVHVWLHGDAYLQ